MPNWRKIATAIMVLGGNLRAAQGEPLWEPGDPMLRHDLELLADAHPQSILTTTWPQIVDSDLLQPIGSNSPSEIIAAQQRMLDRRRTLHAGLSYVRLAEGKQQTPVDLQTFDQKPREASELETGLEWSGSNSSARLAVQAVTQPADDRRYLREQNGGNLSLPLEEHPLVKPRYRIDGSFIETELGNWAASLGAVNRWWGPGWGDSLILSNNARPIPALSFARRKSEPLDLPLLHFLGPWHLTALFGELDAESYIPNPRFFGQRLTFAPSRRLEVGAFRTFQWGGKGRPMTASSLSNAFIGNSNPGSGGIATKAPDNSNEEAGFDFRWLSPLLNRNYAVYGQLMGEDEAGYLPSKYSGLFGIETWGAANGGSSWRVVFEHTDTHADFWHQVEPNVAYEHSVYTDGFRYFNRVVGASIDSDARSTLLLTMLADTHGNFWTGSVRRTYFNNDGTSVSPFVPPRSFSNDLTLGIRRTIDQVSVALKTGVSNERIMFQPIKMDVFGFMEVTYRF